MGKYANVTDFVQRVDVVRVGIVGISRVCGLNLLVGFDMTTLKEIRHKLCCNYSLAR